MSKTEYQNLTRSAWSKLYQDLFDKLVARQRLLLQIKNGEIGVRRISVKGAVAHHRSAGAAHYRWIVDRRKPAPQATKSTKLRVLQGGKR